MTHETAIGTVDRKELETLFARGVDEKSAVDIIVRGMLGEGVPTLAKGYDAWTPSEEILPMPAIEARGLTRDYGSIRAVDQVSFVVLPGEVFGFLGPNGAGKTTTVRMLTTLLEPTAGTALLNGYDVIRESYQARHQFGVVPEESNVYRELSARANLLFSARLYRVRKAGREARITELLAQFGLLDRQYALVDTFSRGMCRKLTIAMALIHRPSILFLDEPTAGLDVQGQRSVMESIRQLSSEGMTIFLTTHQIEEANQLCDRVAIINRGQIVAIGTPERLKQTLQSTESVEVALVPCTDDTVGELSQLPGVTNVVKQGDKLRVFTADPGDLVLRVTAYAQKRNLRVVSLNTLGPSLEDVFVSLTGQPLATTGQPAAAEIPARGRRRRRECRGDRRK